MLNPVRREFICSKYEVFYAVHQSVKAVGKALLNKQHRPLNHRVTVLRMMTQEEINKEIHKDAN